MAKKNRVQETEQSTFDRAKAAFDRVGEDYIPASKVVEPSGAEEPVETPEAEKPVETPDTDNAEPVPETSEPADSVPASDDDNAEAETDVPPDAETSEPDDADMSATEPDDADTPVTEADDAPETSEPVDESVSGAQDDATTEVNDSDAPETDDDSDEPEAVEDASEEPEDASDSFWTFDADAPEAEVTEMEKLTMETKEITLGVHHSPPREADATPREQESKARFKAFERLKDAFKVRAEQADDTPASGSSRDAAIRKRVMQIEDEETRNYLLDRVLPQMTWYSKKSAQYQTMYYRLMAATILMGALIPAFSVGANSTVIKVILALLGASVTGINAYLALHNYHDLWITYRTTREDLIHHLYCYFNKAGVFSSSEDLDVLLVNVCEDTLSKENGGWTTIIQKT